MNGAPETTRRPRQPFAALADLCDGLFDDIRFVESSALVDEGELPPAARELLVHREHMTTVLEARYGAPIALRVLKERREGERYARVITLHPRDVSERVVEFGVVRINVRRLPEAVQAELFERAAPLGDILIRHNVLRRVSPRWYFRFPPGTPIADSLVSSAAYGRVGVIYCNEAPAIELLEVVGAE